MPTGIQLSSGVVVGQPIPLDAKFGPYNSTTDALNDIGIGLRYRGLTVGVYENGVLQEYWFKDGTGNEHFVAKSSDVTWDSLLNKPSTFTPSSHQHAISAVTDLQNQLDQRPLPNEYWDLEIFSDDFGNPDVLAVPIGNYNADITVYVDNPNGLSECYGQVQLPMFEGQKVGRRAFIRRNDFQSTATFLSVPLTQSQLQSQQPPGVPIYTEIDYPAPSSGILPGSQWAFTWMGDAWVPVVRRVGLTNSTINGLVPISKSDVGLPSVDNTSDLNKPISAATQTALNGKANVTHTHPASEISDSTTAGRALLTAADAAAQRTLLNVADGAEVNVNADWDATSGDAQIFNKPSTFPPSPHTHDSLQSGSGTTLDTFTVKAGGINGFFLAKTFNTTDPAIGIESYNTSNVRIGFALLGIRSTNGFLQGGSSTFRIEQSGGALARLQLSSIVNSSGNQLSLPSGAGTLALNNVELVIACSDETSNLTVGANKVTFRSPYAFTLTAVRASVNTAPTGSTLIVDINEAGTSVLSTKLSIDANEKTSLTAATAAVISDSAIANDAEITIDIDQGITGQMGKGLKVVLIGTRA